MTRRSADLARRYRLVVTPEHVAFIEQVLLRDVPEADREAARREALEEAERAELVLHADGTLVSRAGEVEFLRVQLAPEHELSLPVRFEKAPGVWVELSLGARGELLAAQVGKPTSVFVRADGEVSAPRS